MTGLLITCGAAIMWLVVVAAVLTVLVPDEDQRTVRQALTTAAVSMTVYGADAFGAVADIAGALADEPPLVVSRALAALDAPAVPHPPITGPETGDHLKWH